jgi:hypothetical protein
MEARLIRAAVIAASLLSLGAGYRTQNFLVSAPTAEFAQRVATSAEEYRRNLAVEWLGAELPPWSEPCPITVNVGPQLGAGGATSFTFIGGRPTGWTMTIQGSAERVLDSVLPHEITHTIFATHFGCPLPRWADEGACTTVEHASERDKQHRLLYEFLTTGRGIAFNQMFAMKEYPPDVLPLYSQGYSLARFLIAQGGQRKFVKYVGDGMKWNNWTRATQQHYGYPSLSQLQVTWVDWVRRGCPPVDAGSAEGPVLAAAQPAAPAGSSRSGADSPRSSAGSGIAANTSTPKSDAGRMQLASTKVSWYARVRDESRGANLGAPPRAKTARALHQAVSQSLSPSAASAAAAQVVTRPQPPEQAQQRVIEWSQPARPSAGPVTILR